MSFGRSNDPLFVLKIEFFPLVTNLSDYTETLSSNKIKSINLKPSSKVISSDVNEIKKVFITSKLRSNGGSFYNNLKS